MGNDGGSIPKRDDLVKTKKKRAREDDKDSVRQRWAFCALSREPLRAPVVSCPLGKLYNKEAVIAYLLDPPSRANDDAAHLRSLRDVTTLRLTPNPALDDAHDAEAEPTTVGGAAAGTVRAAPFVCPISLREMNGAVKFVYRKPCGCAMSEPALREMRRAEDKAAQHDNRACPVDGERSDVPEEWVTLNPNEEELETMAALWEAKKVREKDEKKAAKAAKRKDGARGDGTGDDGAKTKKQKTDKAVAATAKAAAPAVKAGASVPHLQATLAAKLAEQKKQQSPAIASLYRDKNVDETKDKDGRSTWMTRGAYARF
ncbi:hypothetical protein JCM11491_000807 [Sporobolomyces phaffii]